MYPPEPLPIKAVAIKIRSFLQRDSKKQPPAAYQPALVKDAKRLSYRTEYDGQAGVGPKARTKTAHPVAANIV